MAQSKYLVDTAIFIDYLRGSEIAKNWLTEFQSGELLVSVITGAELLAGCRNRQEQSLLEKELATYPMLDVSESISKLAWSWYRQFHLSHNTGFLDCLIGATAYYHNLPVFTLNDKHFRPLPDLSVERPY